MSAPVFTYFDRVSSTAELWNRFGTGVTETMTVIWPQTPFEEFVTDKEDGQLQLVLHNQCGMAWKPMHLRENVGYHRHVMLFFGGKRNTIDEVSKPTAG